MLFTTVHGSKMLKIFMLSKGRVSGVISLVCLLQYVLCCVGQSEMYLNITRQSDGDIFTRVISNTSNSSCEQWFAANVSNFSSKNCTVECKCHTMKRTYNIRLKRCVADEEILKIENCNGSFLPSFKEPLYDLSKQWQAHLNVSFISNQSQCHNLTITYLNETMNDSTSSRFGFKIFQVFNGSALLTWDPQNWSMLSDHYQGSLLKLGLLCNMTSQQQRSCFIIKTRGRIVKKIDLTLKEHRKIHDICVSKPPTKSTDVMLLYILVGVGCGVFLIIIIVACYVCYRGRRRLPPRHAIPHISSRSSAGMRKPFKTRSVTKNNEPTTPAIHDVIFNELSWDGDGGFSNRALADPRVLDVDYGIPVDFGTLPRQARIESSTSYDSNRNSLSPLTDLGGTRAT